MSPANCTYVIKHNPHIEPSKVELCPNAIDPIEIPPTSERERSEILSKFGIPSDKILFVYGGNLGKPQGLDFLLKVIEDNEDRKDSFIIVVGSGTEYKKIDTWFEENAPKNSKLLSALPKDEYDTLVRVCDVGMIFLDPRFTIPNFPSRLLSYLENSMPVLLATDTNCDMGQIAEKEGFGLWCKNGDINTFMLKLNMLTNHSTIKKMGKRGKCFLFDNYVVENVTNKIIR